MIDLHLHTRASDGTWTVRELIETARSAGLRAIAVTDHDSVDSVTEGMALAAAQGLRFVAGVEISASEGRPGDLHILGYGVATANHLLAEALDHNQAAWDDSERQSLANLRRLGIRISQERYQYWAEHREAGGWPTYNCLAEMGLVNSYEEYFDRYFGPGRPAFVRPIFIGPAGAIAAIKAAGGVPVLAHPGAYDPSGQTILDRPGFLDEMVALGIEGFETIANKNTPAVASYLTDYCCEHGLLRTGGSDCHGGFAGRELGHPPVPDEFLPPLLERLKPGSYV